MRAGPLQEYVCRRRMTQGSSTATNDASPVQVPVSRAERKCGQSARLSTHHFVTFALRHVGMHLAIPRLLHELGLLLVRQAVDDAPTVTLVALHPEYWLWNFLRFGCSSSTLCVLLRREQGEKGWLCLSRSEKQGRTLEDLEEDCVWAADSTAFLLFEPDFAWWECESFLSSTCRKKL